MLEQATDKTVSGTEPLTVVASWFVKPGRESEFEVWHRGLSAAAHTFPGHLGVSVMRPSQRNGPYVVIFKFDNYEHLAAWQESETRRLWLEKARPLVADQTHYQSGYGLEFWFSSPHTSAGPPRWKMALVTMLAIYPLVNLVGMTLKPVIGQLSPWIGGLIATPIIIVLMTYLIMPLMTKIFSRWLFKTFPEVKS